MGQVLRLLYMRLYHTRAFGDGARLSYSHAPAYSPLSVFASGEGYIIHIIVHYLCVVSAELGKAYMPTHCELSTCSTYMFVLMLYKFYINVRYIRVYTRVPPVSLLIFGNSVNHVNTMSSKKQHVLCEDRVPHEQHACGP